MGKVRPTSIERRTQMATPSDKVRELAERLAKLSPEAQEEEIARIDRNVSKREAKAQKGVLEVHKTEIASAFVDTLNLYCREKKIDVATVLPLNAHIAMAADGSGIAGTISGKRGSSGGGGGTRSPSFFKQKGVSAIKLNGKSLEKATESEVLRVAHGVKTAKEVYGTASPHAVALQTENQEKIKSMGFVAVLEDGSEVPLISLYSNGNGS